MGRVHNLATLWLEHISRKVSLMRTIMPKSRNVLRGKVLWVAVALIITVVAAGCSRAPDSRPPEPPKTPEELAVRLFGQAREGSQDPGVFVAEIGESGEFTIKARVAILKYDSVAQCTERVRELLERVFEFDQPSSIDVEMVFVYRDASGNIHHEAGLTLRMLRETHERIDWETMTAGGLPGACDEWWLAKKFGG